MTDTSDTGVPKNVSNAGAPDAADGSDDESMAQKSRPSSATIFTIATTIILTFIVLGFIGSLAQQPPVEPKKLEKKATDVEVMTVKTKEYVETVRLPSRIEADRVAAVSPEIGGILKEWTVAEGAAVQAGDVVAVLDTELLESQMKGLAAQRRSVELSIQQAITGKQLAEINAGIAKEQLASLQNDLSSAKSNYDLATKEYVRIKSLVDSESLNKSALDSIDNQKHQAKVGYDKVIDGIRISTDAVRAAELQVQQASDAILSAQAGIEQLDAGIESLSIQIRKSKVLAPIDGILESHAIEAGELASPGFELAKIYDLNYLRVVVNVPDRVFPLLDDGNPMIREYINKNYPGAVPSVGAKIILKGMSKLSGGRGEDISVPAAIHWKAQASDPLSNTFRVELRLKNPASAFKQGQIVDAEISLIKYDQAILIPLSAAQVTDSGPQVLVAHQDNGDEVAEARDVDPVSISGGTLFIAKGLTAGDRLIVTGWKGVLHGQRIRVIKEDGISLLQKLEAPQSASEQAAQ